MYGTLIAATTVGAGGAASITFSAIPQTYTDLYVVFCLHANTAGTADQVFITYNGSASSFSYRYLTANGSSVSSSNGSGDVKINAMQMATANGNFTQMYGNAMMVIPNYTGSAHKVTTIDGIVELNTSLGGYLTIETAAWTTSTAITSITFTNSNAVNWTQYSTAYLYGLK